MLFVSTNESKIETRFLFVICYKYDMCFSWRGSRNLVKALHGNQANQVHYHLRNRSTKIYHTEPRQKSRSSIISFEEDKSFYDYMKEEFLTKKYGTIGHVLWCSNWLSVCLWCSNWLSVCCIDAFEVTHQSFTRLIWVITNGIKVNLIILCGLKMSKMSKIFK